MDGFGNGFAGVVTVENQKIWNMELGISVLSMGGTNILHTLELWKMAELFGHGGRRFGKDTDCLTRNDLLDNLFIIKSCFR